MREACEAEGINTDNLGGRQHFLRYDPAITPKLWDLNGFTYDSSLGYADKAGFRTGVCYEYTMYNLAERKKLHLKQRPLVVMECTIISERYEGLGFGQESLERLKYFEQVCKNYSGDYTLLWHNSFFSNSKSYRIYEIIVSG